jgi:hemerythrin-like domain-containing protein
MAIQIGSRPDSGFDNPLGMLQDCHRRIERFLHVLSHVATHASGRSLNGEESAVVTAALHYFQEAGRRHNADEEESLFPRLRAAQPGDALVNLAHLEADHRTTELLHREVEMVFRKWIEASVLSSTEHNLLVSATAKLQRIYAAHIHLEESSVFPLAAQVLDQAAITAIGSEFQARRK